MKRLCVLVTRPEPGASATARALAGRGFEPIVLPLTRTEPVACGPLGDQAYDALALTSANAIRHASVELTGRAAALPVYAVGEATAAAARARQD